jgi:hypothetical protein
MILSGPGDLLLFKISLASLILSCIYRRDKYRGFGLVIGFIDHSFTVTHNHNKLQ